MDIEKKGNPPRVLRREECRYRERENTTKHRPKKTNARFVNETHELVAGNFDSSGAQAAGGTCDCQEDNCNYGRDAEDNHHQVALGEDALCARRTAFEFAVLGPVAGEPVRCHLVERDDLVLSERVVRKAEDGNGVAKGLETRNRRLPDNDGDDDEQDRLEDAGERQDESRSLANL